MSTYDEFAYHAWQSKQQNTDDIYQNEGGTTIFAYHIREAPYVAQSNGTACRS
jgi:hypothetical protein